MSMGYQNGANNSQSKGQPGGEADWDTLKEDVGEITGAALEHGRHFLDSAREQATTYVDRRKDDIAQSVTDFANSLRESTRAFDDRPNIQAFADGAAEGLEQLAETIRARSFGEIFNEMEHVVRRRPAAVAGVTFAAGFLVARFIKASADNLRDGYDQQGGRQRQAQQGQRRGSQGSQGSRTRTGA